MIRDSKNKRTFFTKKELQCKCGCNSLILAEGFPEKLRQLRELFSRPMIVNSCCRCPSHNAVVGGADMSYHLTNNSISKGTCAIDILRRGYDYDSSLIQWALSLGWSVGLHRSFIHIDRRIDYGVPAVIYHY